MKVGNYSLPLVVNEPETGIFGVMTVKLDDAEYTPRLISLVHPFCIMSTSLGLRIWQVEEKFYLVGQYKLENQQNEISKDWGDRRL